MNRQSKIALLNGIKTGVISTDLLKEPKTFVFIQKLSKAGYYESEGTEYSENTYKTFCNKIEDKNRLLRNLDKKLEEDKVITIIYV
jgi:hypothetical protein